MSVRLASGSFNNPITEDLLLSTNVVVSQGGGLEWTVRESDGANGIQNAVDSAIAAGGGKIKILGGDYTFSAPITFSSRIHDIVFEGEGDSTVLHHDASFADVIFKYTPSLLLATDTPIANVTAGDASITFTTASNAGNFLTNDIITIYGTDQDSFLDAEMHVVSNNGNATSGVVTLQERIQRTLTTVKTYPGPSIRTSNGIVFRNLKFVLDSTPATSAGAIIVEHSVGTKIENCTFSGWQQNPLASVPVVKFWFNVLGYIKNCRFYGNTGANIWVDSDFGSVFTENQFQRSSTNTTYADIYFTGSFNSVVSKSKFCGGPGTAIRTAGSIINRRLQFIDNEFDALEVAGIQLLRAHDCLIQGNNFNHINKDTGAYGIYNTIGGNRNRILNNQFSECRFSVYTDDGDYLQICNNQFYNGLSYPIYQSGGKYAQICNNTISGGVGNNSAIGLADTNAAVVGNVIANITGKGISLVATSGSCSVQNNTIVSTTSDAITTDNSSDYNMVNFNHAQGLTITTGTGANNDFIGNKGTLA